MNKTLNAISIGCCLLGVAASLLAHNWPSALWAGAAAGWCWAYIDAMEKK
jgi:hypothetical protein